MSNIGYVGAVVSGGSSRGLDECAVGTPPGIVVAISDTNIATIAVLDECNNILDAIERELP